MCSLLGDGTEKQEAPSLGKIVGVQAAGGVAAGATASCITTPLDTIKTRLQVQVNSTLFLVLIRFLLDAFASCFHILLQIFLANNFSLKKKKEEEAYT